MNKVDEIFIREIERQEARYWSEYYLSCADEITNELGIYYDLIAGAACCAAAEVDMLGFNRVMGLGISKPIREDQLNKIIEFYKNAGAERFFVQVSPVAQVDSYEETLQNSGFEHYNNWSKFYKKLDEKLLIPENNLTVEEISFDETETFNKIMKNAFEFEEGLEKLLTQTIGRDGWKHYLAKENDTTIGAASVFINGKYASLAIAGTKQNERGKGAQTLLITQRLNDAYNAGCEYIIVETAEDKPDKPSASNRNIKRFGFEQAYLRPNYIYTF